MKHELIGGGFGTLLSATGTALQTNEVLQTISLAITILGGIITIIMALLTWWKNAKKDGKITKDEIEEGVEILQEGIEKINDSLDDKKEGDKKDE